MIIHNVEGVSDENSPESLAIGTRKLSITLGNDVDYSPDLGYGLMIRLIISRSSDPPPEVCISLTVSTGRAYLRLWRLCFTITDEFINWRPSQCLAFSVFYSKTGFWPSYCQISTDLDKILHTLFVVRNIPVGRLRPRSARGRLQAKSERLCFFVILVTHPKSYIETTDRRDFGGKPSKWRCGRVLSWLNFRNFVAWAEPQPKTVFYAFLGYSSTVLRTAYRKQFYPKSMVIAEKPFQNSGVTRRLWTLGRLEMTLDVNTPF